MKKNLAIAILASSLVVPFAAQAQGVYVGASIGLADHKVKIYDYSASDDKSGYKLYGGFGFNEYFGLEIGYSHLGKLSGSDNNSILIPGAEYKAQSVYVAATGTIPLSDSFSVFGKTGLVRNRATLSVTSGGVTESETRTKSSLLIGLGAAYHFTKNVSAVFEYENYGKVFNEEPVTVKADMLSLGLRYKF